MKRHYLTVILLAAVCAACTDDRNNYLPDDALGFAMDPDEVATTVSIYDNYRLLGVAKSGKGFSGAAVTVSVDNASMEAYNAANGTAYTLLPRSLFAIEPASFTMEASDFVQPVTLSWDYTKFVESAGDIDYVIPVRMDSGDLVVAPARQFQIVRLHRHSVGFEYTSSESSYILATPVPEEKDLTATVTLDRAIAHNDLDLTLVQDLSLVDDYNAVMKTEFLPAPEGLVTLSGTTLTLSAGEVTAALDYTVHPAVLYDADGNPAAGPGYVLPLRIAETSLPGLTVGNPVVYIVVRTVTPSLDLFTRLWGYYSTDTAGWAAQVVSALDGNDRSLAIDDEYLYIPQTSAGIAAIHKFDLFTGAYLGTLPVNADMSAGTHWVSCARMMPNTDPAVNGGKDILVVSNLADGGEPLRFFAYVNGTSETPVTLYNTNSTRRFGDKFTVWGSYQTGRFYLRSFDAVGMTAMVNLPADAERTASDYTAGIWTWLEPSPGALPLDDVSNISEFTMYPGQDKYGILSTNSDAGAHLVNGTTQVALFPDFARSFGWQFFEKDGDKYVACASLAESKVRPKVIVLKGDDGTLDGLRKVLTEQDIAFQAPLQHADNAEVEGLAGGNGVCDCCVRVIDGQVYMAALAQRTGISVFRMN